MGYQGGANKKMKRIHKLSSGKFSRHIRPQGGRNNKGVTTVFNRGGGNRKLYRIIDYKRSLIEKGLVKKIQYDPNRNSKIALICYESGILSFILAPKELKKGDTVSTGPKSEIKKGNALQVREIPIGTSVHNLEIKPGGGGKIVRAGGNYAKIIKKDKYNAIVRLSKGKLLSISTKSMASIGILSLTSFSKPGKAGRTRWKGLRPKVRGVAMNSVDHPHGGGEGKSKGGKNPVTPWGKITKGKATSKKRRRIKKR